MRGNKWTLEQSSCKLGNPSSRDLFTLIGFLLEVAEVSLGLIWYDMSWIRAKTIQEQPHYVQRQTPVWICRVISITVCTALGHKCKQNKLENTAEKTSFFA